MAIRIEFEKELSNLHKDLIKMGTIIEESLDLTIEALKNKNISIAKNVIERDDIVDELEAKIEKECVDIICRQQPVAGDLRTITSILKIITDLERIADHCTDISEFIIKISHENKNIFFNDIINMIMQVKKMLKITIDSYISQNYENAVKTSKDDDIVDDYFETITIQIQNDMKLNKENIISDIYFLFITKYLERMADHITNVCEWIEYRKTGIHNQYN